MTLGQPGEPGRPGEPPENGRGGAGGAGGRGGRGGRGAHPSYMWAVTAGLVMIVALAVATLILRSYVHDNAVSIRRLRAHDREQLRKADAAQAAAIRSARRAEYRLCVRQTVTRVAMNDEFGHDEPTLPLYDCRPNLIGEKAKVLTPTEARQLTRQIRRARFTP